MRFVMAPMSFIIAPMFFCMSPLIGQLIPICVFGAASDFAASPGRDSRLKEETAQRQCPQMRA